MLAALDRWLSRCHDIPWLAFHLHRWHKGAQPGDHCKCGRAVW